ncbi:MAG: PaaI family thioesterase [Natronohydrobacter sp.]|nr:PaaI family thioesterase [Natronohydrobacter sp.]
MIDARVAASFGKQSMMASLGAELVAAGDGRCIIRAPRLAQFGQQHGAAHAAVAFALGDSAAGYAALTLLPEGQEVMTAEMKINLLSPAMGEGFEALGEVVRAGRRLTIVRAEVFALDNAAHKSIAVLQGTMIGV